MSAYAVSQLISKGSDIRHENPVIPSDTPIDIEMACKRATTPMSGPCATKLRRLLDHAVTHLFRDNNDTLHTHHF
jgi:hypothetical protein